MQEKNVLVVGTGTIGLPLIGLLARHKERFNIDNVFFNKHTPLRQDAAQIKQLIRLGAQLVSDPDRFDGFAELGLQMSLTKEEAIKRASVIIDCTPKGVGLQNKRNYYEKYKDQVKGFIAQGSENGFGKAYAKDIVSLEPDDQFVQVVSCNTHSIASLIKSFESCLSSVTPGGIISGDFVCVRRANDISQDSGFIPGVEVGGHKDDRFGTHHAKDAFNLLKDQFPDLNLYSSALKSNTQYMHTVRFSITLDHVSGSRVNSAEDAIRLLANNKMVALTEKVSTNKVFSFGRDFGLYGRILSQTVVSVPTVSVRQHSGGTTICGMCMTPQDGNSLLSSVAATLHFLDSETADDLISIYNPYVFQEI